MLNALALPVWTNATSMTVNPRKPRCKRNFLDQFLPVNTSRAGARIAAGSLHAD
jgi:hypothetical protein